MYVYVLKSLKDGKHYVGMTDDVVRRVKEHNNGLVHSTRYRRPFELVYSEEVPDRRSARSREKYFKSAAGRRFLRKSNPPDRTSRGQGFGRSGGQPSKL